MQRLVIPLISLIIGTLLTIIYIVFTIRGREYEYMSDSLSVEAYPFRGICSTGFAIQDVIRPEGQVTNKMWEYNNLYYGQEYGEFYTRATWAQIFSFSLLLLAICFVVGGLLPGGAIVIVLIGVVFGGYFDYSLLNYTKGKIDTRQDECDYELPNAISKLALLVNAGVVLREAWMMVSYGKEGTLYDLMKDSCDRMNNGVSDSVAIHEFGVQCNSADIKKLASSLIQNVERGGAELSHFLTSQSTELWAHRRQLALQRGERAASALLGPIAVMFAGVMFIILGAVVQNLSL